MSQSTTNVHQNTVNRPRFEELISEISAHFINLPTEKIDSAIEDAQRQICECFKIDLSALWQWTADNPRLISVSHLYGPPDGPAFPEKIDGEESFPWVYHKVLANITFTINTRELPPEAAQDQASRLHLGVKSSLIIPLKAGGSPICGVLTFDTLHQERVWSTTEIKRLKLAAQIFSNALIRKETEEHLRESELRLSLAAESADVGIWELNYSTKIFWSTPQARKIFGYRTDEEITMERFEQSIHPDDREQVLHAVINTFQKGEAVDVEYRILTEKARLKWVSSKGRPCYDAHGKPERLLGISFDISERKHLESELKNQLDEVESLKRQLENENHYLREDLRTELGFEQIIGKSKELKAVLRAAKQVASTDATVLILGETGTGKGLIAHAIHQMSPRSTKPFITVNCAALPHNLIESELFGREKGAFTGSYVRQSGRFEVANHGTIFLDEIGELPLELQAKLLRVLQDGEFERLGSTKTVKVDVRVISATARDLREHLKNGSFREDLFYRLNVFPITLPPLRARPEDIPLLAQFFVEKYARKMGRHIDRIPKANLNKLMGFNWPGNVRELEHLIERSVIISPGSSLTLEDKLSPEAAIVPSDGPKDLASIERRHILEVLQSTSWKIEGSDGAAVMLDLHPSTVRYRLKKLGIRRPV